MVNATVATGGGLSVDVGSGLVSVVSLTGSLFGAMTVRTRARDLVLASVMFPLLLPTLLAAVAATRDLFGGASLPELLDYLMLMTVFDVVFAIGGLTMFGPLMEG